MRVIRVHIVLGGVLAFCVGALLAAANGGQIDPATVVLCYAVVFFGDLSVHYSNDYFDVNVDKRAEKKTFFSGSRVLALNPQLRPAAHKLASGFLFLSCVLAAGAVAFAKVPVELFLLVLVTNGVGWAYSAPPLRLVARGIGEVVVATGTGFVIPAVGYLSVRGQFDSLFAYLAVPFVLYGFILSLSLGASDIEIDRECKKRTLAARIGEHKVFVLIAASAAAATVTLAVYAWQLTFGVVDFRVVALGSIMPLAAGLFGFARRFYKKEVTHLITLNIVSLFLFNAFMVAYLTLAV
ncbi:MAG: prenyltransferase [Candidatus Bathyarchaeota archaeon]|nr:prenyltransferase [Candidatus Bathyarchaeota archaeon]